MKNKITIIIPAYNSEKTIAKSIKSALAQNYPLKEILVMDDASTDDTVNIAKRFPVKVVQNDKNLGIGLNLAKGMSEARTRYVVYLCGDDLFADTRVVGDIVRIFDQNPKIGVIDRYYYQFMNGYGGAVMVVRENNLLISSCNPSGMAFRKMEVVGTNRIFIEMPYIVTQYLRMFEWTRMEWDTVAVRIHPGGNTGTKSSYYVESPVKVWTEFLGDFKYHLGLIQIKNRAPKLLWREIWLTVALRKQSLLELEFWACAIVAASTPSFILRNLSNFYRHRINRRFVKTIERGETNE